MVMGTKLRKQLRHEYILKKVESNPFIKDNELAEEFGVSVSTIRLDRAELGISEYRERLKDVAEGAAQSEPDSELLDLNLFENGVAVMMTDDSMVFEDSDIVKSHYIYAFAEKLALSVIDAKAALIKIANVKYITAVHSNEKLFATSKMVRNSNDSYIVHVVIKANMTEVFRGKFSLVVQ